ncbi:UNVERIFIED_CONTAM: hypothetical protein PYX00_003101 [Menopon gallinae]|uniref:Phenylalanine--tRNA ligase beta subunit n=1 Tax=Menopon gallinae TaxID=328185 RepID=A0AAW2I039_9NEOP
MPTIGVKRDLLFKALGKKYTDDEFAELCFAFGLELDEVTSEKQMICKEQGTDSQAQNASEEILYRIDIPANRYDLLCLEGLARSLLVFLGNISPPNYIGASNATEELIVMPDTAKIRPHVVAAVLRNIEFNKDVYDSFIDLQDKLHQNIGRKRTLVSIGTHDLDTIKGPFYYDAKPPNEIKFVPLNQTEEYTGAGVMDLYANHAQLKQYLHIIKDSPVYPVITDSNGVVLSLPPIINGNHSKITLNTKNVFIEVTATDLKKAETVIDTIVAMFSEHCSEKYSYEPVRIKKVDGTTITQPKMRTRKVSFDLDKANKVVGIHESQENVIKLLSKMGLVTAPRTKKANSPKLEVLIPPTRHDILHERDVVEDLAIAYGYNNIEKTFPKCSTVAQEFPLNKLSDHLREELARCGFTEALTFSLCSVDDLTTKLRKNESQERLVTISNPKTLEFQACRTRLLPCVLKTISSNKQMPLPMRIFEVSDVVLVDQNAEVGARNERHLCAVYYNKNAGFEVIHGVLDRIMQCLSVPFDAEKKGCGYYLRACEDETYFPKRCAEVIHNKNVIGTLGILHPNVIKDFELGMPCSALEINIEPFL